MWSSATAQTLGLPGGTAGSIITYRYGTIAQQLWMPTTAEFQIWARNKLSGGWTGWARVDAGGAAPPAASSSSGTKLVPLMLAQPAAPATSTTTAAGTVRFPLRFGATVRRFRLRVSNRHERGDLLRPGNVSLTGAWFGPGDLTTGAFTAAPTQIMGAASLPSTGAEWTSPWLPASILKDTDYLLSVGFTTDGQTSVLSTAGAYQHAASTEGATQSAAGFTRVQMVPLSWWIEAEVPVAVPVVAGFGDSNTIGTGTTLPVFDSWLSQHARAVGALPLHDAYGGTSFSEWNNAPWIQNRWNNLAPADAAVIAMGQNDLLAVTTVEELQARVATAVPLVLAHVAPVIHFATITPTSTKTAAQNTVRQQYNAWVKTLPHGARDVFDFAAAVDDGTGTALAAPYAAGDLLHMTTAGHTAMAGAVVRPPVAPAWA